VPEGEEGTLRRRRRRTTERRLEVSASEKPCDESARGQAADKVRPPAGNVPDEEHPVPLFLRDSSDARKGNAQDEKDGVGE
jgi:hypothetical protein